MSSEEQRDGDRPSDADDPTGEATQPMDVRRGETGEDDPREADTTTLGIALPPPVLVEEGDADSGVSTGARRDDPSTAVADSPDEAPTVVSTGPLDEAPTVVSTGPLDEAPTVVSTDALDEAPTMVSTGPPDEAPTVVTTGGSATAMSTSSSIAPSASLRPILLERVEPSLGRGERMRLDASQWKVVLGRAEESDVRLYTASASRQHATIAGNERGEWLLTPAPGKVVLVDGEQVSEPIVLEVGMNVVLGQDHLRCVTEGLTPRETAAVTKDGLEGPADASPWRTIAAHRGVIAIGVGVVLLLGLLWIFAAGDGAGG